MSEHGPPSSPASQSLSTLWGHVSQAIATGQLGTIIGTVCLIILIGQYLGLVHSPLLEAHAALLKNDLAISSTLTYNQGQIDRFVADQRRDHKELSEAMWALCFVLAKTDEDKHVCKEGLMRARL